MRSPALSIIRLQGVPILQQLQLEEALFRAGTGNWCLVNEGSPPAIVMGISGSMADVVPECPVPIIRRFSGGGTVVVDEETLFFTLILNSSDLLCSPTPQDVMGWTRDLLCPAFLPNALCLEEQDYVLDGRKIGGNAQSFSKGRVVHHTSFLWSWQEERMALLSMPQRQPAYRAHRGHESFCNRLSNYFSSKAAFTSALVGALDPSFVCKQGTLETVLPLLSLPHRKAVTVL